MAATTLKEQAMNSATRLASKITNIVRDLSAVSGDVATTGIGFTPTSIIFMTALSGSGASYAIGASDSSKAGMDVNLAGTSSGYYTGYPITCFVSAGNMQQAIVKTYDADGFTLTWTKTGTPTGYGNIIALCFR